MEKTPFLPSLTPQAHTGMAAFEIAPTGLAPSQAGTLLAASAAIATVRERKELFAAILEHIKPVIPVDDTHLLVLDETGRRWQDWTNVDNYQGTAASGKLQQLGYDGWQLVDRFTEYTLQHNGIMSVSQFREQHPEHPLAPIMWQAGLREMLFTPLLHGGKKLGVLFLDSRREGTYTEAHLSLLNSVTSLIAVTVANILATEEILEREREKTSLLNLSTALATAKVISQVCKLMYEHIKPLIAAEAIVLTLLSADKKSYIAIQHESEISRLNDYRQDPLYKVGFGKNIFINADPFLSGDAVFQKEEPYYVNVKDVLQRYPDHIWAQLMHNAGSRSTTAYPLRLNGEVLGALFWHWKEELSQPAKHYPLIKGVGDQVAVAVANILANEEILGQKVSIEASEREKTLQIAVTNALAILPTWEEKFMMVTRLIDEQVPLDMLTVCFSAEEALRFYVYFKGPGAKFNLLPIASFLSKLNLPEAQLARWHQLSQPHYAAIGNYSGEDYLQLCKQVPLNDLQRQHYGIRSSVILPLEMEHAQEGECVLLFGSRQPEGFAPAQFALLEALAPQVALSTGKLLAYAGIQAREKEKSLQVSLTNALAGGSHWEQKFLQVVRLLAHHLPFDYVTIGLGQAGEEYSFSRTSVDAYETIRAEDFFRLAQITPEQYVKMPAAPVHSTPLLLNGEEFIRFCRQDKRKRLIANTFKLQSSLMLPVRLSRKGQFILSFFSRKPAPYQAHHLQLLEKLPPSLSLVLDKLFAYEEIEKLSEQLKQENTYLQQEVQTQYNFGEMVGSSESLQPVLKAVTLVATTEATVLILGETGTGKELIARAVHRQSKRSHRPLIKLNCAALPAQLIESELFGHEKGAFTGAAERRIGKFELAKDGTIFLDEVGELPLELQAKLLRVLQEKEFERLGGNNVIKTNVRVIAATNRIIEKEVAEGKFRADLYFRLNIFPIQLPPLRDRREDIPLLAGHFIDKLGHRLGRQVRGISQNALQEMMAYGWPGNIRELEHVIEQSMIVSSGKLLELARPLKPISPRAQAQQPDGQLLKTLADNERHHILRVLHTTNGRIRGAGGAAEILDIIATTLETRMQKLGIRKEHVLKKVQQPAPGQSGRRFNNNPL